MDEISRGVASSDGVITALQIIPPLMQMYPEIEVHHADDTGCLLKRSCEEGKYTWLFCGHTVYLVAPPASSSLAAQGADHQGAPRVLYSGKDVAPLLFQYLRETRQGQ